MTPVPLDLADERSPQQLFERLRAAHIHVDALINNAGFTTYGMFVDVPAAEELEEIRLNVVALTALIKLFLPPMIARRSGRILNVASTAGYQPGPLMAVYYATKAYVLSLSQALAEETRGTGVTVTTLCPGPTETGFRSRGNVPRTKLFRFIAGESKSVAKAGYAGMMRGKRVVIPGAFNAAGAYMARVSPTGIVTRVIRHVNSPQ